MNERSGKLVRTGASFYLLWGAAHIFVGVKPLVDFFTSGPSALLANAELFVDPGQIDATMQHVSNLIAEYYFNIAGLGILAIIVSVTLLWNGVRIGFWINLIVLGIADSAFFFLEIVPGYQPLWPPFPLIGVSLYVLGSLFAAIGFLRARPTPSGASG